MLHSDAGYVAADATAADYGLSEDASQATSFYFKPSALGAYLLLSDYHRAPGERGSKSLLGISDPAGEFLDALGNFVGEVGYLIGGVGDITDIVLDPLGPGGGIVRPIGDEVGGIGDGLGGIDVNPRLAMASECSNQQALATLWMVCRCGPAGPSPGTPVGAELLPQAPSTEASTPIITTRGTPPPTVRPISPVSRCHVPVIELRVTDAQHRA